ncbi:MAG: DUF1972 domain-containing protein [bacterium]
MNKSIAIIGTVGCPPNYGGFETLASQLVLHLRDKYDFTVYCSSGHYNKKVCDYFGAKLIYIPLDANGIQSIPYDGISIIHALFGSDTLLILGVSGCSILPFVRMASKKRIIINIDGIEWKREKWNTFAKRVLKTSEKIAARNADIIVADNREIKKYLLTKYGIESHLIEYGGDHVVPVRNIEKYFEHFSFMRGTYALSVCRIEPENNIHLILDAFSHVDTLPIAIVGNWDHSNYGKNLRKKYSSCKNLHLVDSIYDQEKLDALRSNCFVYIHGHSAGGTNPALVEAMHLALPVVAFDVSYNRETTEDKALYFRSAQDLLNLMTSIEDTDLKEISTSMSEVAKGRYTWKRIAEKYALLFEN